jgi:adenine phosphoribosyltransferase
LTQTTIEQLKKSIRDIPDFPKKGIVFKDITTLLKNASYFSSAVDYLYQHYENVKIDKIAAIEARGFILGAALAEKMQCGFIPLRKPGRLPYQTIREVYVLEYGTDSLEMHVDAVEKGENILLVDDLIATGGTALAGCKMIEGLGAHIAGIAFLVELSFLQGRKLLEGYDIFSLIIYDSE